MSDIKSSTERVHAGRANTSPLRGLPHSAGDLPPGVVDTRKLAEKNTKKQVKNTPASLISEFVAPAPETRDLLASPLMTASLIAVSKDLAPDGVAESSRDRYVASVVETHLAAKRQLMKHLNSLLRA